ncbi:Mss4-like protein [Roridomyces roridus]|uniref:Mss4-like protein n=1 Tax=Roridomyces roridus TaxID=1738132 RepID=A0AAD7B5M0_9AGAR|nr:Mss4-like protein [Roridomyces roridus]
MTTLMKGSCSCGALSFSLQEKPLFSMYCHCTKCQRAHGAVFVAAMHFSPSALTWTHTAENEPLEEKLTRVALYRCKQCHCSPVTQIFASKNWVISPVHLERDADGNIIDWEDVKPTCHIWYGNRVLDVADSLPKWEGFPRTSTRLDSD